MLECSMKCDKAKGSELESELGPTHPELATAGCWCKNLRHCCKDIECLALLGPSFAGKTIGSHFKFSGNQADVTAILRQLFGG